MEKNTIYNLISHKAIEWLTIEKESPQSIVGNLFQTIEKQNRLRIPQKEAIRNYLWIKFVGRNQKLSTIVRQGLLYDAEIVNSYEYSHIFQNNSTEQFLNQFFVDNSLENLAKDLSAKEEKRQNGKIFSMNYYTIFLILIIFIVFLWE